MKVTIHVINLILFYIGTELNGLEVQPSVKENNILEISTAIRNITNALFVALKLKGVKSNPKLKQYSLIHNFFSTLTLKDHDTLNRIAQDSTYDKSDINNETRSIIDTINELLDEDPNKTDEESNKNNIYGHVTSFLTNLKYLKDKNSVNDNIFNINEQVLSILKNKEHSNTTQDKDSDEYESLHSDNEFWVPEESGRRIFQGEKTKIKYFPFMASIQIFNGFQCGGCIIKSDLVITAASCLQLAWNNRFFRENPAFLSVRVGSNFYKGGGESIPVLEVYFHPDYTPKTLKSNICLLRLMRKIKFRKKGRRVKKIDFDRNPSSLPMNTDGITIVGWGAKGTSNIIRDPWSNQLAFSVLDIYPIRECQDIYSKQYVTQKNFCAGFFSKGGGACNGDVGGPGIVNGVLAGIVSFGSPRCGTTDAPTVFTKLGYYSNWIEEIMEQEVVSAFQRTTLRTKPPTVTIARHDAKPTDFVLEPIFGKWTPPHINALDSLRILDDENLFKEFLSTMFGSKEAKDYADFFVDKTTEKARPVKRHKRPELQKIPESEEIMEPENFVTKTYEMTTPLTITVLEDLIDASAGDEKEASSEDDEVEKNILKLIENMDDSDKENEKEISDRSESEELVLDSDTNIHTENTLKNLDDSILTLLYLSDSEKNNENIKSIGNVIGDFDENVNDGLSIAMDGFKDMTYRHNGSRSFYNYFPKDEMYELLVEAIDDVAKSAANESFFK